MLTEENLERILEELLPNNKISKFSTDWILNYFQVTEDSIKHIYAFLKNMGLKDNKIASQAQLLAMNPKTIEKNYQRLSSLGLKDDKIASVAQLLGRDPKTIEKNYQRLSSLGLKNDKIASRADLLGRDPKTLEKNYQKLLSLGLKDIKIASQAQLLGMNPETIEINYQRLSSLGLKDDKIASVAQLLGRDPKTIEKNYQRLLSFGLKDDKIASQAQLLGNNIETIKKYYNNHIRLLRQDYQDRNSGKELLFNQAYLLGVSSKTINANVQFFYDKKIDYNNGLLLGTTTQLKRKKMAWMLRELFDYSSIPQNQKRNTINYMYNFVKDNPFILTNSISYMEKYKDKLRNRVIKFKV